MCLGHIWDCMIYSCDKLGNCLQPIEKWTLKNIIRANTISGYILLFIITIIWFSFIGFMCYGCYIGLITSDFIRDTWEPYMDDQELLNELCDNQWYDKLTFEACDDSGCRTRTPYHIARTVYQSDIAYLVFISLCIPSSIILIIMTRTNITSCDNIILYNICHPIWSCFCLSASSLAMVTCAAVVIDFGIRLMMNNVDDYQIYCDDSGNENVNISQNFEELNEFDILIIKISHGIGVGVSSLMLFMAIRINLKVTALDPNEYFDDHKESNDEREKCYC